MGEFGSDKEKENFIFEETKIAQNKLERPDMDAKEFINDIIGQLGFGLGILIDINKRARNLGRTEGLDDVVSLFQKDVPKIIIRLKITKKLFEEGRLKPFLGYGAESVQTLIDLYDQNAKLDSEEKISQFLNDLNKVRIGLSEQK
jgi:hypothetical protein